MHAVFPHAITPSVLVARAGSIYAPAAHEAGGVGAVKLKTHGRDASVYVDCGYAVKTRKNKELALRPGNHDIELRDHDGRTFFQERVAVMVGQTTKIDVPS